MGEGVVVLFWRGDLVWGCGFCCGGGEGGEGCEIGGGGIGGGGVLLKY